MGEALLKGWLEAGVFAPSEIVVSDAKPDKRASVARRHGVTEAAGNREAASSARVVVLAVKPQDSAALLDEIGSDLDGERVVVSIITGLPINSIRKKVGRNASLVRVIPNVAALVGASICAYTVDPGSKEFDKELIEKLLGAVGEVVEVDEGSMDLVTALSGSGPAYYFLLVEALEGAGAESGLPRETSRKLARETLWGAAKLLKETGRPAGELRDMVSSPGGTTVAALGALERAGFKEMVRDAVAAARKRAGELSQ